MIALGGQNEAEPFGVIGRKPAIPRRATRRGNQSLRFQKSNLRDRDVRKLRTQQVEYRPDRHSGESRPVGSCHWPPEAESSPADFGPVRKTRRNFPICTSSPLARTAESTGSRLT
ncbi:Uncharacterised protein [Mycobacteroides abscessus subsp. abscessus]|nr:Uncharacterised protein [Mycobacteroides abscessus subsp. abscessus]